VIASRATPADGPAKCFGFVQTYDSKPTRRLFDLLISHGMHANQAVTFLTDGGDDVRDLPLYLNPDSEHLLDWFHVTMRLTVMTNMAKSLRAAPPDEEGLPPPADPAAAVAEGLHASNGSPGTAMLCAPRTRSATWRPTPRSRTRAPGRPSS